MQATRLVNSGTLYRHPSFLSTTTRVPLSAVCLGIPFEIGLDLRPLALFISLLGTLSRLFPLVLT